ncbi:BAI1-associated protein 3-like isoform X2 [Tachypleus tridentatus]|uniref:BAI1-associated protein 3-like isoform X2 n=1 Tax=Tachypleus tridentatus TaxID=6853 RepID=UPI003FCF0470
MLSESATQAANEQRMTSSFTGNKFESQSRCENVLINQQGSSDKCDQDADESFFENFTALSWKQENRRLQSAREDESETDQPPPSEPDLGVTVPEFKIVKKELEHLYVEVLYIVKHKIGASTADYDAYTSDLCEYAKKAFQMSPEKHCQLLEVAHDEKPPIPVLNVIVVEAQGLEAKDPNGFSDPYCMLGILAGGLQENRRNSDEDGERSRNSPKRQGLRKFGASFKRRDRSRSNSTTENLPAKFIRTTTVKPHTLNPKWNEKFRLDIDDVFTEKLHLDIWDHDDETSVFDAARKLNEVSGLKGLGRYFKQIYQSARGGENNDDFLGCVTIPVEEIPATGLDKYFPLQGRTSRSTIQGQIRLKLSLGTREDRMMTAEEDNWREFVEHQELLWLFIEHELKNHQGPGYTWAGDLQTPALTILHQHAIQGDITELQKILCRWIMYARKHMEVQLDYALLKELLENFNTSWNNSETQLSKDEEAALAESYNLFIDFCLARVRKHWDIFPYNNKQGRHKLIYLLKCIALIYSMKVFRRCCPFRPSLHVEIINTLKKGTLAWFDTLVSFNESKAHTEEKILQGLIKLVNIINSNVQKGALCYDHIFESSVKVNYTSVVYKHLEKLIGETTYMRVEGRNKTSKADGGKETQINISTSKFELYMALQEFVRFKDKLPSAENKHLVISNYYTWFTDDINLWLTIAKLKAKERVKKALELDKIQSVDSSVKYNSTSSVDVVACFAQIKEFWFQLSWPDVFSSYPFIIKILEVICSGATFYANLCYQNMGDSGRYDEDIREQLCIAINNIQHVRKALKPLFEDLEIEQILIMIAQREGDKTVSQCRTAANNLLHNAEEDVFAKIQNIANVVAEKMRPDIKTRIFHLAWTPEKSEADVAPLLDYLDSNLKTLYNSLFRPNFDCILESIWKMVLQELTFTARNNIGEKMTFFQRLLHSLKVLVDFFHAGSIGLQLKVLHNPAYQDLEKLLTLHKDETNHLIQQYINQRLEEQQRFLEKEYGYLSVKAVFNPGSDSLCIDVMNARDLRPLDPNGFSDPFVIIELVPRHLFPDCPRQMTKIQKKTLHPIFDESFEFNIAADRCRRGGVAVCFVVMDHDVMTRNDFEGEAYLQLQVIPGVNGQYVKDLKPTELCLMQPRERNEIINALEVRSWDKTAQEFAKEQRGKRP